ncbi:MAG TPA: RNA polymerase sigma factor, partial [Kofleriaceae bacterium]
ERAMRQGIPDDVRNPRAYLATIMHNLFIDRCRAAKRYPSPEPLDDVTCAGEVVSIDSADEPAWMRITLDDVRAALAQIEPTFARVYVMHAFEHRSYEQIATELAIERTTVGTRLNRARVKLRRILVERLGPEGAR